MTAVRPFPVAIAALGVTVALGGGSLALSVAARVGGADLPVLSTVPGFTAEAVTPAGGTTIRPGEFAGAVWIAGFVFTRCSGPCPLVMAGLTDLQRDLPRGVRLAVFTVDPAHDTTAVLRRYAARFGAESARFWLVRPDARTLYRVAFEGFRVPVFEDRDAPEGARVTHSTRLALVDARGRVRGLYDTQRGSPREALLRDAAALLARGGA